jgi:transposase
VIARRQRRTHSATFKAQVAVAALRGDKTIAEVAEKFGVHPNQVTAWKAQLLERSSETFGEKADGTPAPNIEKMEAKIGSLTLENDFLESALINAGLLSAKR